MLIRSFKSCVLTVCLALSACAMPIDDESDMAVVMPSRSTSTSEVASAIQELIRTYPVCTPVRSLRLVGRPALNFDPHSRDAPAYEEAEAVLDLLVGLGYLTKTGLPDLGKRVFKFDRTERGNDTDIIGADHVCFPAERVLVSVTSIERWNRATADGRPGYLIVDFTHTLDPRSRWAQEPAHVELLVGKRAMLQSGPVKGRALLSRVWLRSEHPLKGAPHTGALWAVSYDPVHNRWEGGRWGALSLRLWNSE